MPLCVFTASTPGSTPGATSPSTDGLVDITIAGEYEPALVAWVDGLAVGARPTAGPTAGETVVRSAGAASASPPAISCLALDRYARLASPARCGWPATWKRATAAPTGAVTVPSRWSTTAAPAWWREDAVVADVAQLVDAGARHITFGDPDFLNGPHHAVRVVAAVHGAFPDMTFDITTKVEHVLRHRDLWPALARSGSALRRVGFRVGQRPRAGQTGQGPHGGRRDRSRGRSPRLGYRAPPVTDAVHPVDHGAGHS